MAKGDLPKTELSFRIYQRISMKDTPAFLRK